MFKDDLGERMKAYESVSKGFLVRKTPAIIRVDGKAFHTFTRGFDKPFDMNLIFCMNYAAMFLCKSIQGCKLAYVQSDEISLLLTDYDTEDTDAWFAYTEQKMASVSASMATASFNSALDEMFINLDKVTKHTEISNLIGPDTAEYYGILSRKRSKAMFDSRVFSLPKEEVCNYFIWRQNDATRNSIQSVGREHFSQKQMHEKSNSQVQEMLFTEKGINWNMLPTHQKRGRCVIKGGFGWKIDNEIPVFTQDRNYIDSNVYLNKEE